MRIIVKYPTRERGRQAFNTFKEYITRAKDNSDIYYLVTYDFDDKVTVDLIDEYHKLSDSVICIGGHSKNKINAINRDVFQMGKFDILVASSDDMTCVCDGLDEILRQKMTECFPDTDGVLHFNDGYAGKKLNTLCIMGYKYYQRFNYIYNPEYTSLWCDNEFQEVSEQLGKAIYDDRVLFRHDHFSNNQNIKQDALMRRTQAFYHSDNQVYLRRKSRNFDL